MPPRIKLVTFDALHTLITPRLPIAVQYAQTFEPYLGPLDPGLLSSSFKRGAYTRSRVFDSHTYTL